MRFGVLGPLAVWTDQGEPVTVPGVKVRALLADLLVHEGRTVPADRLVDDLWGEDLPGNPAGTLSAKVSQLRKALGDAEPGGRELVVARPPGYQLAGGDVDARQFASLVERAGRSEDLRARAGLLGEALGLWRGPAYADFADEPFVQAAAARLEELRLAALEDHAEARLALGEHAGLVGELAELVGRYPLRERLRAAHMRALYAAGRQSEALASYAELRGVLADELGLDPSAEIADLHQRILAQDPALDVVTRQRSNLPAPLGSLVGREEAIREVRERLATDRLVTLTGPGGVGKTRLAVETARGLEEAFPDGVWFVELAALPVGATGLGDTVMAVLDLRDVSGGAPVERLAGALRDRRALLVLDNCEHVIDPAAELAGALLAAAPGLRILATSREPLGLGGEVVWAVPPLEIPDRTVADPEHLARVAAVRLFVERAAAAARGFALDGETAGPVATLCRRLDGIPLALELAATRVRSLGVHGLVARLDDRLRLLATGNRGAPPRQQTLLAMIDWSWELLDAPERIVLRRLAVHVDGCTLEAAEAVCADDQVGSGQVLDLLARLVDRSLVVMVDGGADGPRYRLLESVAAYCTERLHEAGEYERVRERHQAYYTALAERAERFLYGHEQKQWLRRLDAEAANLRAALPGPYALRLVNALAWYWFLRGRLTEARRAISAALQGADEGPDRSMAIVWQAGFALLQGDVSDWDPNAVLEQCDDPGVRARAEWFLGWMGIDTGDLNGSEELLGRALAAFRDAGDRWGEAAVLVARSKCHHARGELAGVERDAGQASRLFAELGDRWGQSQASEWLGAVAEMTGDYARSERLHREGLRLAEELHLWPDAGTRRAWLGWIALQQGRFAEARELGREARRLGVEHGNRQVRVFGELDLAFAARRLGDLDEAEARLTSLLEEVPEHEPQPHTPMVLYELGFVAELRGDAAGALKFQLAAFDAGKIIDAARDLAGLLIGLAGAVSVAGRHAAAARLLGAADAAHRRIGLPVGFLEQIDVDRITARVRAALGEDRFAAEFETGTALTYDQARALATG